MDRSRDFAAGSDTEPRQGPGGSLPPLEAIARDQSKSEQRPPSAPFQKGREWFPELLLLLVTTGAGLWARGRWIDPVGDVGTWWSATYRLANGEQLYRDLYLQFGPLSPYLLAFGARIFGASATYMAAAFWIAAIAAATLLLRCARPFLSLLERVALVGLILGISVFAPGPGKLVFPYAPGAVHALALSLAALLFIRPGRRSLEIRAWLCGLLAGLAFSAKQEIGLACLVALIASAYLTQARRLAWIGRVLAGFCVPAILAALLVLSSAPVRSLREESHVWPLAPAPPDSWVYLYRLVGGFADTQWAPVILESFGQLFWSIALFAVVGLLITRERRPSRWLWTAIPLSGLVVWWALNRFEWRTGFHPISLSMAIAILVVIAALAMRQLPERGFLLALGAFAALLGARTAVSTQVAGPYSAVAHFASALTWIVFLCIVAPRVFSNSEKAGAVMRRFIGVAVLAVSWQGAFSGIRSLQGDWREEIETRRGPVFVDARLAPFFRVLAQNLRPGERIWVLPEINAVDALFETGNVSPYLSHMPGWLDEKAEVKLLERVEVNPPDTVALFARDTREYGVEPFGRGYDRLLAEWIARNYSAVETIRSGSILRRRAAAVCAKGEPREALTPRPARHRSSITPARARSCVLYIRHAPC